MPYVTGGEVMSSQPRSLWRLSDISTMFWDAVNFVVIFVRTLIDPNYNRRGEKYTSDYRPGQGSSRGGGGPPPPGGPRRRIGGFRGGPGGPACPPMAGGG